MTNILRKIQQFYIKTVQKILIFVFLLILYTIGFGITKLFIILFQSKIFKQKPINNKTYWEKAKGFEADYNKCLKQS